MITIPYKVRCVCLKIEKVYLTGITQQLLDNDQLFKQAFDEVISSICSSVWPRGSNNFTANNSEKNINGVVPLKENCYIMLEEVYNWFREKPLDVLKIEKEKGGPIDVYKEFREGNALRRVGLEFETGNIGSGHRAMQKLILGINRQELDLAIILMPVKEFAYYLTDRITNYEELEPYFENAEGKPFIFIGFNADAYDSSVESIPKGKDGMSKRSVKKWGN
ncbi:restriction endonuclease [Paenibacillus sp. LjRoot153]|uniref:restriction endonuclease n=1 Tax=Paenibacillus sp. LjRoot153 TaxID=3342270 RepID=UPI003ECDA662